MADLLKKDRWEKMGDRLEKAIEHAGLDRKKLVDMTSTKYGDYYVTTTARVGDYIAGRRGIPEKYITAFSDITGVERGYLTGLDDFKAENYDDYLAYFRNYYSEFYGDEYRRELNEFTRYNYLTDMIDKNVVTDMSVVDETITDYELTLNGVSARVSADRMRQFEEDVRAFVKKQLLDLIEIYRED